MTAQPLYDVVGVGANSIDFVYRPGVEGAEHRAPQVIDAQPVLKEFALDLAELFATLDEDA